MQFLIGILLLYLCLLLLPASRAQKNLIFLLLAASWWAGPLCFGPNYTPFRFFLTPFLAILIGPRITSTLPPLRLSAEILLAEILLVLVSPEQAVAFTGAALSLLVLTLLQTRSSRAFARVAAALALSALLLIPLSRTGLFDTGIAMTHGGYNFPVLPTAQQLPLFTLLLVGVAALLNTLRHRQALGSLELLILLGCFLLPAAFGRSDTGHFLINTIPATLAGFLLLAPYPKVFRVLAITYAICVLLLPAPILLWFLLPVQRAAINAAPPEIPTPGALVPFAPFTIPIAMAATASGIAATTGYYYGVENMVTGEQVLRQVAQLNQLHPTQLLLPDRFSCLDASNRWALHLALATPIVPRSLRTSSVRQPLCTYIEQHYAPAPAPALLAPAGYQRWIPRN